MMKQKSIYKKLKKQTKTNIKQQSIVKEQTTKQKSIITINCKSNQHYQPLTNQHQNHHNH